MAITVTGYNKFWEHVGKNDINLDTDTFKIILVDDYDFEAEHDTLTDIGSVELDTGAGYTAGGQTITNTEWGYNVGLDVTRFDGDDITWEVSGADLGPTTGAIILDSTAGNLLVCYIDFGGEETAGDDTDFKITFSTDGIFSIV